MFQKHGASRQMYSCDKLFHNARTLSPKYQLLLILYLRKRYNYKELFKYHKIAITITLAYSILPCPHHCPCKYLVPVHVRSDQKCTVLHTDGDQGHNVQIYH